jgi:hypothetical protein
MNNTGLDANDRFSGETDMLGGHLPPGRMDELRPHLRALMTDLAALAALESLDLEPLPPFRIGEEWGNDDD